MKHYPINRRHFIRLACTGLVATTSSFSLSADKLQTSKKVPSYAAEKADFYVSTTGDDGWSGTREQASANSSNGPFATLTRARDAVRALKRQQPDKDIVVLIRGGLYQLNETVVFGLEDSGEANITYAAYPGEKPVFSSGKKIAGWKKVTENLSGLQAEAQGKIWQADITSGFTTLYDESGMLPRARSNGFIPLKGGKKDLLKFPHGLLKNWANLEDVEVVVRPHHAWIMNILPLMSVDEAKQIARTTLQASYAINQLHFLKDTENCWVENVLEALNTPGEWAVNSQNGKVYLWPRGDKPSVDTVTPQLLELIRIEGQIDKSGPKDLPVKNLHFSGLTFKHGKRYDLSKDDKGLQHDWDFHDKANALVRLRGTENCRIEHCHFLHSGSGAIRVDLHGQYNTISNNHIEHLGGAGILLAGYGPGTKDVNRHNVVYNNHIHHVGEIYAHSAGILVWQSGDNRVANNLIHNTHYCGLILSGCMTHFFDKKPQRELTNTIRWHELGELHDFKRKRKGNRRISLEDVRPYLHSDNNMIENNEIHHVMESMGDGNGIYIRGAGAGNVIRRNYVHHLVAPMKMQSAIRTDGGQKGTLITENIIYKCTAQGIILKLNNRAENNIIADIIAPPRGYYLSLREGPSDDASIKNNIFYASTDDCEFINELPPGKQGSTEDRRGRKLARSKDADTDGNIYFCKSDVSKSELFLAKQQAGGVDLLSLATDPMFVDISDGDFRLDKNSPALKLGFIPIERKMIGLQNRT